MKPYASDLSDAEWTILEPFIPPAKVGGRPRSVNMRQILNGIFYVLRSGGAWRLLPHEYPPGRRCMTTFVSGAMPAFGKGW
jgi:putative transposase